MGNRVGTAIITGIAFKTPLNAPGDPASRRSHLPCHPRAFDDPNPPHPSPADAGGTGIGTLLVRLRSARGWSRQRVADEHNTREGRSAKTGKEIGRYEREARIPLPCARKYLAQVFDVDVGLLDRAVAVRKGRRDGKGGAGAEIAQSAPAPEAFRVRGDRLAQDAVRAAEFARRIAEQRARHNPLSGTCPLASCWKKTTPGPSWTPFSAADGPGAERQAMRPAKPQVGKPRGDQAFLVSQKILSIWAM
ncbi:hypothetical protein [Streptomyces sp. NPDC056061]|uniref:hypothetical protein n=1 Tax=Streptomyces sp. NPDC056061 TaxID=3345700 RepID=UPI0035D79294